MPKVPHPKGHIFYFIFQPLALRRGDSETYRFMYLQIVSEHHHWLAGALHLRFASVRGIPVMPSSTIREISKPLEPRSPVYDAQSPVGSRGIGFSADARIGSRADGGRYPSSQYGQGRNQQI